jgi:hypothetical protein
LPLKVARAAGKAARVDLVAGGGDLLFTPLDE